MSEALKTLNNIRILRVQSRGIDLEILEELLEKIQTVVEERREEEVSVRKAREQRQAKIDVFRLKLLEEGIDPAELLSVQTAVSVTKITRAPKPARYKYTDLDGNERTWTGQGRTPKAISEAIVAGKTLADFEI